METILQGVCRASVRHSVAPIDPMKIVLRSQYSSHPPPATSKTPPSRFTCANSLWSTSNTPFACPTVGGWVCSERGTTVYGNRWQRPIIATEFRQRHNLYKYSTLANLKLKSGIWQNTAKKRTAGSLSGNIEISFRSDTWYVRIKNTFLAEWKGVWTEGTRGDAENKGVKCDRKENWFLIIHTR